MTDQQIVNSKKMSVKDKAEELIKFVNYENRVPKPRDVIDINGYPFQIGKFWSSIKQGQNADLYMNVLSKNHILSANYDEAQKNKTNTTRRNR